jgi:hypothetical protein
MHTEQSSAGRRRVLFKVLLQQRGGSWPPFLYLLLCLAEPSA